MTRNCARVFVAAVWSRCWPDFPRYSRLLKSRLTRPGAIWECANWGKNRVASGLYNRRAAMSSSPMRTLAVAEITGQAHKLRAGARCDCRKRTVKGRYARRRHLQSLDKIILAEDYAHFVERRRPIPLSFRVSARGNSCWMANCKNVGAFPLETKPFTNCSALSGSASWPESMRMGNSGCVFLISAATFAPSISGIS